MWPTTSWICLLLLSLSVVDWAFVFISFLFSVGRVYLIIAFLDQIVASYV